MKGVKKIATGENETALWMQEVHYHIISNFAVSFVLLDKMQEADICLYIYAGWND